MSTTRTEETRDTVRAGYARIAAGERGCCTAGSSCAGNSCCGSGRGDDLARAVGYADQDLDQLPEGANMGLSCGNPTAVAELREGETVLDLGSGGGLDVFIAGRKVGPTGRAIGVDMTAQMLAKARANVAAYTERTGLDNVEFRLGEIEHLPVGDNSVDVVLSNCVINLSPDKPQVWREIARVLKPGGRAAISDLALLQPLPQEVKEMAEALVGCIAGAVMVDEIRHHAVAAGLTDIKLAPKRIYSEAMEDRQDPLHLKIMEQLPAGAQLHDYVTSVDVRARKA